MAYKLTFNDHRISRSYPVPDSVSPGFIAPGMAVAAFKDGLLVAIRYWDDLIPKELAPAVKAGGQHGAFVFRQWMSTPDGRNQTAQLAQLGELKVGYWTAYEFLEF